MNSISLLNNYSSIIQSIQMNACCWPLAYMPVGDHQRCGSKFPSHTNGTPTATKWMIGVWREIDSEYIMFAHSPSSVYGAPSRWCVGRRHSTYTKSVGKNMLRNSIHTLHNIINCRCQCDVQYLAELRDCCVGCAWAPTVVSACSTNVTKPTVRVADTRTFLRQNLWLSTDDSRIYCVRSHSKCPITSKPHFHELMNWHSTGKNEQNYSK